MKQFSNRCRQRGALFIEYALILSFVIAVGTVFLASDNNIITSVDSIFGDAATVLADASGEKSQMQGSGDSSGNSSGGQQDGSNGSSPTPAPSEKPADNPDFSKTDFGTFTNEWGNPRGGNLNNLAQNMSNVFWNALQPYSNPASNGVLHYGEQDIKSIQFSENGQAIMTFHDGSYLEGTVNLTDNSVKKEWALGTTGTLVYDTNRQIVQHDGDLYTYVTIAGKEYGYKS